MERVKRRSVLKNLIIIKHEPSFGTILSSIRGTRYSERKGSVAA